MAQDSAYTFVGAVNPNLIATAAPPIPLAGLWSNSYCPTPDRPLINLAQGVPGDPPPVELLQKLAEAAGDPTTTGYGPLNGDGELRRELARDVSVVYGPREGEKGYGEQVVKEEDVAITAGCNLAFYATALALARPGDAIILPTPWYFNHEMICTQLGITILPLVCTASNAFLPSVSDCAELIAAHKGTVKAVVLVTPNNPTGAIYSDELLRNFADLAVKEKVPLVLDETYREFIEGRPHSLFAATEWRRYLIHLFSFSKSYAIPGHRLGALIASPPLQQQISKLLDCLQICPARPAQRAVTWAVEATRSWREGVRETLAERQRVFKREAEKVGGGWEVQTGAGYFAYVRHPYPSTPSQLVAQRLGEHCGVVVLPGSFFSPPFSAKNIEEDRFIRFSIANVNVETLKKVPERLRTLDELWPSLST